MTKTPAYVEFALVFFQYILERIMDNRIGQEPKEWFVVDVAYYFDDLQDTSYRLAPRDNRIFLINFALDQSMSKISKK